MHHLSQLSCLWTRFCPLIGYLVFGVWSVSVLPASAQSNTRADEAAAVTDDDQAKRFEAFSQQLSGATLQGLFSIDGRSGELKTESYDIQSVSKLPTGDLWLFKVRIRYGDHDVNVPLPLTVSWAGTTPVIVVDQLTIPGLGTFDARVVISQQRYAGTWQHGDVGGHLFGKIVTAKDEEDAAEAVPEDPATESE